MAYVPGYNPNARWRSIKWACPSCQCENDMEASRCWNCDADTDGNPPQKQED